MAIRQKTYTIAEAAELTGLSRKAIARRIERGSLGSVLRDGRRRIPRQELVRTGLLGAAETRQERATSETGLVVARDEAAALGESPSGDLVAGLVRELVDRLERQAVELAQYRVLVAQADSLRVGSELADLRARVVQLEVGRPPLALPAPGEEEVPRKAADNLRTPERKELWLPPQVHPPGRAVGPHGGVSGRETPRSAPRARGSASGRRSRTQVVLAARLLAEVIFLVAVSVGLWLAELRPRIVFAAMALAWLLVALVEWLSWRHGNEGSQ